MHVNVDLSYEESSSALFISLFVTAYRDSSALIYKELTHLFAVSENEFWGGLHPLTVDIFSDQVHKSTH